VREAAAHLEVLRARHPDDPEALDAVVACMTRAGSPPAEVAAYLDRLCAARPNDPSPFRARLELRRKLGDRDGALADAQKALEIDPGDADTRLAVAGLAVELGKSELAERELTALIAAHPADRVKLGTVLARAYYDAGDLGRAEVALNEYAPAGTDFAPARILRGVLDYEAGRYGRAEAALRGPAAADTDEGRFARYYLARALVQLGRAAEAKPLFDRLEADQRATLFTADAANRPDDMAIQVRAARASLEVGKPEEARRILDAALSRLGPDREALSALADCYEKLGRPQAATDARKRAAEARPK